jgi:hypothetical protein
VRRILHDELHFHPYKLAIVQELSERDFNVRRNACEALLEHVPQDALVFFTDEAHFYVTGCVNMQNMRYWATDKTRELHQRPLHSPRVTVWCAISSVGIIGPWFFEENEQTVTVTSDRYVNMLEEFFLPRIDEMDLGDIRFQQDEATAHTSRASMAVLRDHFPGRLISLRGNLEWPARSPDLTSCDFFFCGVFEIPCLYQPPTDSARPENKHSGRNGQHTHQSAGESDEKQQNSVQPVYRQWGASLTRYDF